MPALLTPALDASTIGWYLPPSLDVGLLKEATNTAPFLVVKGRTGVKQAHELSRLGVQPTIVLDPAENEAKKILASKSVRTGWVEIETGVNAAALVSPGTYLYSAMSQTEAAQVLKAERDWVAEAGGHGFAAVCVDAHYLRDRGTELVDLVESLDCDVWLTLSHANDPFSLLGTVTALVELVTACPRVALMRSDMAGLGAAAFGSLLTSIGLSGSVRHSPAGGGGVRTEIPVVFVRTLQSFRKADTLAGWVQRDADIEYDLRCLDWCCEGGSLLRYADPAMAREALVHNMVSVRAVVDEVMELDPSERARKFVALAKHAWFQHERLSDAVAGIRAEPQLRQWAELDL